MSSIGKRPHNLYQHSSQRPSVPRSKLTSVGYEVRYHESKVLMSTMNLVDDHRRRSSHRDAGTTTADDESIIPPPPPLDYSDDETMTMFTFSDGNSIKYGYELVNCVDDILAPMDGITKMVACQLCH